MSERQTGYYYVETLTPQGKDVYQVSHDVWSQDNAFEYFESEVSKTPSMPNGQNVVELYNGEILVARRAF